jgi:hypothetical protein
MEDAFGGGNMAGLGNPIGVADDAGKQPRAGKGIRNQWPAEEFRELEKMGDSGLV